MIGTDREKSRQQKIKEDRARVANMYAAARNQTQGVANPMYGTDPFEPSSYLPTVPSDPALAQPLASGRFVDPRIPSGAAISRAVDVQEFRNNPDKYIQENISELNNEQSLIDRGSSMMGRIFNYRDESDLELFNVNLSAVESTWDGFLRYFTGAFDLLNIGFGGLISAAPGGVQTLSYTDLSGGKSVGEVLSGEMEPGSAPSPGQIAITSIGLEAKRIREGQGRLSDILLMNPATAPFILAALAADTSPVQKDGFNIMDKEQRDNAFSSGFEQWMSGVTDAGLMLADPLIGVGVAAKVMRAGALGKPGTVKYSQELRGALDNAVNEVAPGANQALEEVINIGATRQKASETPDGIVNRILEDPEYVPTDYVQPVTFPKNDPIGVKQPDGSVVDYQNPLSAFLHKLHQVDDDGVKVLTPDAISRDPSFDRVTDKATIADLLHKSQSPAQSSVILQAFVGTPGAQQKLALMDAGMADIVFRYRRDTLAAQSIFTEPQKVKEVADGLAKEIDNTRQSIDVIEEQLRGVKEGTVDAAALTRSQNLNKQLMTHKQNLAELEELKEVAVNGKQIDYLDPTNPFYRQDLADDILGSLLGSKDAYTTMVRSQLFDAGMTTKTFLPSKNNAYARMVMDSRGRRQTARYQYAAEGTSIFPKKFVTEAVDGKVTRQSDGWFSPSQFEGTSRFARNMRVWRWMGAETPNGFIGLKSAATVGSEREFTAALNTDLYKGGTIRVQRDVLDENGKQVIETVRGEDGRTIVRVKREDIEVGGIEQRQSYYRRFYEALNNPDVDAKQVLDEIEMDVTRDYAAAYGVSDDFMQNLWSTANKRREQNLDLIRKRGYFVDPETGTIQFVPYLDAQLANGTYMQNWGELEKILKREVAKDGGERLRAKMALPADAAGSAYNMFNNFWRPLTLMRLSYTQRNILEGTFRAMAYSSSLAPLLWPIKATSFGVRNKVVRSAVDKRAKAAGKVIDNSEYGKVLREYNDAVVDEYYWQSAIKKTDVDDAEPMVVVFQKDGSTIPMTEAAYESNLTSVMERVTAARENLKGNADKFDAAVGNTAFGKWRQKNIKDLETKLQEAEAFRENIMETAQDLLESGGAGALDDNILIQLGDLIASEQKYQIDLDALRYEPSKALNMYRTQAGRQKRIGSGKSMGPDGNYYNDAFAGALEQINRGLMSADNTVTQQLSLRADIWNSLFYKTMVKQNTAVMFGPGTRSQWVAGMSDAIEEASSSWLIRSLVANQWDEAKVFADMTSTNEGRVFLTRILSLMGEGNLKDVADTVPSAYVTKTSAEGVTERAGIKRFAAADRTASGSRQVTITDKDQARVYINEVANQVKSQMQNRQEFMALLERRVGEKSKGAGGSATAITPEMVDDALKLIPEDQQSKLGYIQGATVVRMGTDGALDFWAKMTSKIFKALGTIPEDAITRGGFYNMQYKASRNALIESYLVNSGRANVIKKGKARGATNADQGLTIKHDDFTIPASELSRMEYQAHRQALRDTREWMYTIERRTNLGKYGEWIFPFISATQNSATVAGKLLYKEPWLAPMIADLWRMPSRLGIEDENGNLLLPMPMDWVKNTLANNPDIPVLGGVVDSADLLRIPKDGLNVFMPETGFGIAPRPTPWVQVAASELMKANAFPVETPQIFKSVMGEEGGNDFYKSIKDYMFGEQQGASDKFMSWDKLVPAYAQKAIYSRDELSAQYGYQYTLHYHTQMMRFRARERDDMPTEEEIAKRTTNSFWFGFLGNQGIPTPLTPFPIITRPQVDSPVTGLQEVYQKLQNNNPLTANMEMDRMFGDWGLEAALTKVTQNVGGANPTPETISDIETLSPLIRSVAPDLGTSDLGVLGILVNNRRAPSAYEQSAYNWQKAKTIPGTNREWREVQSPEEAVAERQRIMGWTIYRQEIDKLDAQMYSAGLSSYELVAAAPYKAAKERLRDNMLSNPDYAGWIVDYQDQGGSKTLSAVRVLESATQNDEFRDLLVKSGKEQLLSIMDQYVEYRRLLNTVLDQSGHSINHESNIEWKVGWDAMRLKWRNSDERWAEIDSLYLSGDSNPQAPGNLFLQELASNEMQGGR